MTTDAEEPTLTIDELAARAGVTVRTVRFYGTKGLLPPPVLGPRRVGHYGREHLDRLALIEELQRQGLTLAGIERYLRQLPADLSAHDLAIHRAVVASWAPDTVETVTRRELARRAGRPLDEEDVERLVAMGVVRPAGDGYEADLGLLRLGAGLLDVPLSPEAIFAARKVLLEHARAAARELSQLFRGEVAERDARDVRSLSAHMHPLVVQALLTAFQRSLQEELGEWLTRPADGPAAD
ncbi:MerR family transcriptional regulator [Streptomyces sp. XY006]|uniref:MerR family transcriptional regulator n=1 Tax=Streptomyces sp. XY006 TaxID=2021410 RepID=UPI0015C6660D|nr:MerR family transcriptional regulator [Streptomyces sp. XY006]